MKGHFDEVGIFWEEMEPTFFAKIKASFGYPQPPRGYIPHRPEGMSGWCGNALHPDKDTEDTIHNKSL